jgi:hypothetical protein
MSLAELYVEKRSPFAPPPTQTTYEQFVFDMERNGTNDLVERNEVDDTFRPPLTPDTYLAQNFQSAINQNSQ